MKIVVYLMILLQAMIRLYDIPDTTFESDEEENEKQPEPEGRFCAFCNQPIQKPLSICIFKIISKSSE